jgi:hypothetical protein
MNYIQNYCVRALASKTPLPGWKLETWKLVLKETQRLTEEGLPRTPPMEVSDADHER